MYAAVFHADALFGVPNAGLADGPSLHYTLVFNVFVMMQLFNQVSHSIVSITSQILLVISPNGPVLSIL